MWKMDIKDMILYEDRQLLVCRKPAGLAVQNSRIGTMDMENALKNYLAQNHPGKIPYLGIIHRLDQPVEGVLVFAKTVQAAAALNRQMERKKTEKIYLAVSDRIPENKEGLLEDYLLRNGKTNSSAVVSPGTKGAKRARLFYRVLQTVEDDRNRTGYRCLLKIRLDTGRHHQIRVQMAHAGLPLLGDRKYYPEGASGFSLGLCSCRIAFQHPQSGKWMEFHVLPEGDAFQGFDMDIGCLGH